MERLWGAVSVAALLLAAASTVTCQGDSDFFFPPIERSFAQVQPPVFPNTRQSGFYSRTEDYRPQAGQVRFPQQQPLYNNAGQQTILPSPNYNQNPSPFQLPTGRSQPPGQFYLNQADYSPPQRTKFRPSLPQNYQFAHPASTNRPDTSQIHSALYQNDPSRPEQFLGQITLNNPDTDFLPSNRFNNLHLEGNSLRNININNNGRPGDDIDDFFDINKVTTYNPIRQSNKNRGSPGRGAYYDNTNGENRIGDQSNSTKYSDSRIHSNKLSENVQVRNKDKTVTPGPQFAFPIHPGSRNRFAPTTKHKEVFALEPLLEDDDSDPDSFKELMKNAENDSYDVEVIKENSHHGAFTSSEQEKHDNNPSASSMNEDNLVKEKIPSSSTNNSVPSTTEKVAEPSQEEEPEYVEYYEDIETTEETKIQGEPEEPEIEPEQHHSGVTTEPEYEDEESPTTITDSENSKNFEVLVLKENKTLVKDDNFEAFVDTAVMDQFEHSNETDLYPPSNNDGHVIIDTPPVLRQEVVSVVTTKSVVNGTISIPEVTISPITTKASPVPKTSSSTKIPTSSSSKIPNTTENWVVVASVQTSRSVSGARFLPFPTVEQEEKKQVLTEDLDDDEIVTKNPKSEDSKNTNIFTSSSSTEFFSENTSSSEYDKSSISTSSSTENINDKLDSIQSELSSAVLSGHYKDDDIAHITESSSTEKTTSTTSEKSLNLFTLKMKQTTPTTEKSSPEPLPVMIKKFDSQSRTTTTPKPKRKLSYVTVQDDLTGLLPPGFKPRQSFKDKKITTTTTTTTTTTASTVSDSSDQSDSAENNNRLNGTQGRSSGISSKNKVTSDDISTFLPKDYKTPKMPSKDNLNTTKNEKVNAPRRFVPPGLRTTTTTERNVDKKLSSVLSKATEIDISAFLPKDYTSTTTKPSNFIKPIPITNLTNLLPPGFKLNETSSEENLNLLSKFKLADVSNLLPPGYKPESEPNTSSTELSKSEENDDVKSAGGLKVVFPSRPGNKANRKNTTPKPAATMGPSAITPVIHKGWPTRASTEFTGWPSPSTTPFSLDKLLEAHRNATATSPLPEISTTTTTRKPTTTTTTTQPPPPSTTPGVCNKECDIAGTIKIVSGVKWVPELLDHNTEEWKKLAKEVKDELNSVYSKSDLLKKYYKGIRIDAFSKGSVLVDYFVELSDLAHQIDTLELKQMFHKSLTKAKPGSLVETITESLSQEFNHDVMLGDQPEEERDNVIKKVDKSDGKLEIGKFVMDPAYTEFIVLPKRVEQTMEMPEESFLPQWGIAVIVIALASLLFVIIFGVTVLVNRQKSAKAKQPIPLSEDMLRELDKSHMGGLDDMHQLKERELPYPPQGKRMSTAFIEQLSYPNNGDSWRSEWTPQLQQYMQHYTPDSGRGSQIYGTAGHMNYGYSGSQVYGHTGAGSQIYGYTGEYPPRHYSRRRSDYDSNF